ncbi:MAG TPA: hypothetical protein VF618_10380 [Thermoanaerobaculia bacterium]
MRRGFNVAVRGLVAVAVVCSLAMPAEARTNREDGFWFTKMRTRIAQLLNRLNLNNTGDGMSTPKP